MQTKQTKPSAKPAETCHTATLTVAELIAILKQVPASYQRQPVSVVSFGGLPVCNVQNVVLPNRAGGQSYGVTLRCHVADFGGDA